MRLVYGYSRIRDYDSLGGMERENTLLRSRWLGLGGGGRTGSEREGEVREGGWMREGFWKVGGGWLVVWLDVTVTVVVAVVVAVVVDMVVIGDGV